MRFSLNKSGRTKATQNVQSSLPNSESSPPQSPESQQSPRSKILGRSATVSDRTKKPEGSWDRRSVATDAEREEQRRGTIHPFDIDSVNALGLESGASTAVGRARAYDDAAEHNSALRDGQIAAPVSMSGSLDNNALSGKLSSDSGQNVALDRWSQRRLQRLNTEQGFREQRQGGHGMVNSPASFQTDAHLTSAINSGNKQSSYAHSISSTTSNASHQTAYHSQRTGQANPQPASGFAFQAQQSHDDPLHTVNTPTQAQQSQYSQQIISQQRQSPSNSTTFTSDPSQASNSTRPSLQQNRHISQQQTHPEPTYSDTDATSMSSSHNASSVISKAARIVPGSRQSVHTGNMPRDGPPGGGAGGYNSQANPSSNTPNGNTSNNNPNEKLVQAQQQSSNSRGTPGPPPNVEDMSSEDVAQLLKDHKELREKYTKVKKYYFEKEDQVKQLQNSLAHQRLSQSRTSLDDSEYTTRFSRLDGLIAQLAFSIRKSWKTIPGWLHSSVNKDAVIVGKQEMTAVGRAVISSWIVEECFKRYFHPDLDPSLSIELKRIQQNIRYSAPQPHSAEEEEALTSKIVNWRLTTLEGLSDAFRSSQCAANRAQLTETLKQGLIQTLTIFLQDPPPPDLEGGVHMIVELIVSIALHLPLESRDVVIEYYMPGLSILNDQMKLESGIPSLSQSMSDDHLERLSNSSHASDVGELTESVELPKKKRSMLSALTGTGKGKSAGGAGIKHAGAAGSTASLHRPESTHGEKESRVRMAAGIGVQIRGRGVLLKAPVFST